MTSMAAHRRRAITGMKTHENASRSATRVEGWSYTFPRPQAPYQKYAPTVSEIRRNDARNRSGVLRPGPYDSDISFSFADTMSSCRRLQWWNGVCALSSTIPLAAAIDGSISRCRGQVAATRETIAAKPTSHVRREWGQFLITPPMFTGLV